VNYASSGNFSYATSFASPILLAAAFDDEMIEKIGTIISTEARAFANVGKAGLDFWFVFFLL
jgi:xylan 1,4-beta-xylosidase